MSKSLEKRLKNWKVIGTFKTKGELKKKIIEELNLLGLPNRILEYYIDDFEEYIKFHEGEEYALNLRDYDYGLYKKIIEREKRYLKRIQDEKLKRRQAQKSMSIDDYRIVQKQQQAEYLVEREMKRMAKMVGKKKLLPYKPKVYVLRMKDWNEKNCSGYVTEDNKMFLPENIFKRIDFYDPYELGLKKITYKKDEDTVKTIRHELTHLFIREEFKDATSVNEVEQDASPIYLYYLALFSAKFGSGYKVQSKYKEELCEKAKEMTYENIKTMSLKLLGKIELAFEQFIKIGGKIEFTKDEEISYIGEDCTVYLGYNVIKYTSLDFVDLNNKLISKCSEKVKEVEELDKTKVA